MVNKLHGGRRRWLQAVGLAVMAIAWLPFHAMAADEGVADRLVAMILSHDADTRALAFRTGRALEGDAGRADYRGILWQAWQRQETRFAKAQREGADACGLFANSHRNWQALGRDAMRVIRAEVGAASEPVSALENRFEQARRSRLELERRLGAALAATAAISAIAVGLDELEHEIAMQEGRPAAQPGGVRARLARHRDGRAVLAAEPAMLAARAMRDAHLEATLHNREQFWAPGQARRFASLLNERRKVLGLEPLRLERRLSQACAMHTREMRALGYFDHQSPVTERRTPGLRARAARFGGSFEGENLYRSERPQSADSVMRSWWLSDSHRIVLFAGRPNAMGLDPGDGTHWTLMTGRVESS